MSGEGGEVEECFAFMKNSINNEIFFSFFDNLQKALQAFIYWCFIFTLFRLAFIFIYSSQLNGIYDDVPMALLLVRYGGAFNYADSINWKVLLD